MRWKRRSLSTLALLLGSAHCSIAADQLPWAFNAPAAEGYSITLKSVDLAPGTPLISGTEVTLDVFVSYKLSIAKHGVVVLVPQDDKNRSLASGGKQVTQEVALPEGQLHLAQSLKVPRNAKEVRLFIPLVPDGISHTTGEITIRYPVVKK